MVFQINCDDEPAFGMAGFRDVRPQLQQEERRRLRGWITPAEFSEAAYLLQELHHFYFGSHVGLDLATAVHVPRENENHCCSGIRHREIPLGSIRPIWLAWPARMTRARSIFALFLFSLLLKLHAQEPENAIRFTGDFEYKPETGLLVFTNGVTLRANGAVLTAQRASLDENAHEVVADGQVQLERNDQTWTTDHMRYNFETHQVVSEHFRTGKPPAFAEGYGLYGVVSNQVYYATNAYTTSDDISKPAIRIRARNLKIIPGKRIEATHATLYLGDVPVFYFPYYSRNLGDRANNFSFLPGYRSVYGPFVLGSYTWFLNDQLDGIFHLDYREKRGVGVGPDFNFHLGRWGDGAFRYYYTRDDDAKTNFFNAPVFENRQRVYFSYQANPFTNLNVKSLVRYQNDIGVLHDFFPSEYRQNPQPDSFVEVNKFWQNFSLDVLTRPRVNDFYETVERLPDVRLNGFRQQLGDTPLYYESESTVGYYRRLFAETNGPVTPYFEAARADTYHQIVLPKTFFGWLNFTPRAGGRFTYYSEATGPGATTDEQYRGVFNTGAELTFKASRLWPRVQSEGLDMDGLRHIIEPSINYIYVPKPNARPNQLPQFDYELASLRLLPIEYPEYNAIDSIDSQNVIRFGLKNKLQTKREGLVEDLLSWEIQTDWRLHPRNDQRTFADVYSDLTLRPRSWVTFQSQTRYDIGNQRWRMALDTVTFVPNDVWNWTIGNFYLHDDFRSVPTALGQGNNLIMSSVFYRLNENWGFRANHHFDVRSGRMQEQFYSVYRDLRSWTAAITGGIRDNDKGPKDYTIAFTFSLKAIPKYPLGTDTVGPYLFLAAESPAHRGISRRAIADAFRSCSEDKTPWAM